MTHAYIHNPETNEDRLVDIPPYYLSHVLEGPRFLGGVLMAIPDRTTGILELHFVERDNVNLVH